MKSRAVKSRMLFIFTIIALFAIPITIGLVGRQQDTRSQAATGTELTFDPASSESEPLNAATGEDLTATLQVVPGDGNLITFVKFVVEYDPEIFDLTEEDFALNEEAFPELLEGPTIEDGRITASLSVGSDPAKAISDPEALGTLTLKAKKATGTTPTTLAYTTESEVLSIGEDDDINENVLSSTGAAIITVGQATQPTTAQKTGTPSPTTEEKQAVDAPDDVTSISLSALLHGIGSAGDSVNPTNSTLSNKEPKTERRPATAAILDENGEDIVRTDGELLYDQKTGKFAGLFSMDSLIEEGTYTVLILVDQYLPYEEEITITEDPVVSLGDIQFITGDIVTDGVLDILDYNTLTDCGYGAGRPLPMDDPDSLFQSEDCQQNEYAAYADLDDNGMIDNRDFNLFLRELSKQSNAQTPAATPAPTTTPTS